MFGFAATEHRELIQVDHMRVSMLVDDDDEPFAVGASLQGVGVQKAGGGREVND